MPDAKLDSAAVSDALQRSAVVAVLRAPSADTALHAIEALVRGGLTAIEVTYSTPNVPFVLSRVRDIHERLTHGVGTVTEAWQVEESVAAGAQFIVSPGIDDAVIAAMHASGRTAVVGAITPSEIMRARQAGMSLVKIFPASLGGPAYLRALREPFPDLRAIPTGGGVRRQPRRLVRGGRVRRRCLWPAVPTESPPRRRLRRDLPQCRGVHRSRGAGA